MLNDLFDKAAPRGERARIEQLLAGQEARVRRAFRRFLDDVKSQAVRRQVRIALRNQGVDAALRVIDAHVARMGAVLSQVFQAAGTAEAQALARQMRATHAGVAIAFDPTYPRAAALMRQNQLSFVTEFSRAQRESTRDLLTGALQEGAGPIPVARALRDSVGLTAYQRQVVANYRRGLEMNDASVLSRDLRDRRFLPEGSPSREAFLEGEPLGPKKIQRMVEVYRTRFLQYRAETIARTETMNVVGLAREEALQQIMDQTGIQPDAVTRTWRATMDSRTRDTHAAMNGQERGRNEPFQSPLGARLMFPGDRSLGAPGSEVINCRCTLLVRVKP